MYRLVITQGAAAVRELNVASEPVVVGSGAGTQWTVSANGVLPQHLEFRGSGGRLWVRAAGPAALSGPVSVSLSLEWVEMPIRASVRFGDAVVEHLGAEMNVGSQPPARLANVGSVAGFSDDRPTPLVAAPKPSFLSPQPSLDPANPLQSARPLPSGLGGMGLEQLGAVPLNVTVALPRPGAPAAAGFVSPNPVSSAQQGGVAQPSLQPSLGGAAQGRPAQPSTLQQPMFVPPAQPAHQVPQQPQFAQPQPQFAQPQFAQPQFAQPQFAQPQFAQPQPQFAQPQFVQPQPGGNIPKPAKWGLSQGTSKVRLGILVGLTLIAAAYVIFSPPRPAAPAPTDTPPPVSTVPAPPTTAPPTTPRTPADNNTVASAAPAPAQAPPIVAQAPANQPNSAPILAQPSTAPATAAQATAGEETALPVAASEVNTAATALLNGRLSEALAAYRLLQAAHPDRNEYRLMVRILERRLGCINGRRSDGSACA